MKIMDKVRQIGMLAALAQQTIPDVPQVPAITDIETIQDLVQRIVLWVLIIAGVIAVLFLIGGGLLYLTAGGNPEQVQKAKTTLVNAIIGIIVIALAFAIYVVVINLIS